jgi:hypothetical protein
MQKYANLLKGLVQSSTEFISQLKPSSMKEVIKIDKSQTIREARCFNENDLQPEKLCRVIKHLIYHFNSGEKFTE